MIGYFRQDVEEMQGCSVLDEASTGCEFRKINLRLPCPSLARLALLRAGSAARHRKADSSLRSE